MATTNRGFVSQQGHAEHCKDNGGMHKAEQINRLSQKIMRRNYFSSRCCLGVEGPGDSREAGVRCFNWCTVSLHAAGDIQLRDDIPAANYWIISTPPHLASLLIQLLCAPLFASSFPLGALVRGQDGEQRKWIDAFLSTRYHRFNLASLVAALVVSTGLLAEENVCWWNCLRWRSRSCHRKPLDTED